MRPDTDTRSQAIQATRPIRPEFLAIEAVSRPIRPAILVQPTLTPQQETHLLQAVTTLWGGKYALMLQLMHNHLQDADKETLLNYSPDILIGWGDDVPEPYLTELREEVGALGTGTYNARILGLFHQQRSHPLAGVSMANVAEYIAARDRPADSWRLCLPRGTGQEGLLKALRYTVGDLPDNYADFYASALKGQSFNYEIAGLNEYLETLSAMRTWSAPIGLTSYGGVRATGSLSDITGLILVITQPECAFRDAALYWNLRNQAGFLSNPRPVLVPWSSTDDAAILGRWVSQHGTRHNYITLASTTLDVSVLLELRQRLAPFLPESVQHADIWHSRFELPAARLDTDYSSLQEIRIYGRHTELQPEPLPFAGSADRWITAIRRPPARITDPFDDFQWPHFRGMSEVIGPDLKGGAAGGIYRIPYYVRVDHGEVALYSMLASRRASLKIPDPAEMARAFFRSHGFSTTVPDRARYTNQLLRLAGGTRNIGELLEPHTIKLFQQMASGRTYTAHECVSLMRLDKRQVYAALAWLIEKRLLLRGYRLRCSLCDLKRWYALSSIDERFSCPGCLTELELPLEPPLAYRLNELAARAVDQGSLGVLGGIGFLTRVARETLSFQPGLELTQPSTVDIDLVASVDGALCAVECKTLLDGADWATAKSIVKQMKDLHAELRRSSVRLLVLFTLAPTVPEVLQDEWQAWASTLPAALPVAMVSAGSDPKPRSGLWPFLPKAQRDKSGWIREPGTRTQTVP